MNSRFLLICTLLFLAAASADAARYQRTKDGKTLVWNSQRGVAQEVTWSGLRDMDGYATGQGTLTWYRLGSEVNSYTGKMVHGKFEGPVVKQQGQTSLQATFANGELVSGWSEPGVKTAGVARTPKPQESPTAAETEPAEPEKSPEPEESAEQEEPTPIPVPTTTPTATPRSTAIPVEIPTATSTPFPTPRSTPTFTPTPIATPTATPKPLPTSTPVPTATATPAPTRPIATPTPVPTTKPTATPIATSTLETVEIPPPPTLRSVPTSTPAATPKQLPTFTPTPVPTLRPTSTPTPKQTPRATPASTTPPTSSAMATPIPLPSFSPLATEGFDLAKRPSSSSNMLGAPSLPQAPSSAPGAAAPGPGKSPAPGPRKIDAAAKQQLVAELKQKVRSVFEQVRTATGNFQPIERLDQVKSLPNEVSSSVTLLTNYAHAFRATLGYETTYFECLDEIETVGALGLLDEATRDLVVGKDGPAARKVLAQYQSSKSEPSAASRKALWHYLNSMLQACDRSKNEAAKHLTPAQSLESAGKRNEALAEYREIYRIYPSPLMDAKIKALESPSP